ncbi:MAG: Dihydrolipoyllysine-residue acetyltransferase component of pyruvate dehydrogenase complex [Verrucomicrobiae bacterium]|nr:Dihydrolipoyllysine-residue acetyltransferase component of pyruvate dehydrogenase complex [Verrucomicrobiae bacterium]
MDIRLPSLGEGADSGVVVNILVKEGDTIAKDQTIIELETDKAVGSIPSSAAGVVQKIKVNVGDKISAGAVILSMAESGAGVAAAVPAAPPAAQAPRPAAGTAATTRVPGIPAAAAPSVRKMAAQLGIDLALVPGSGHGGRIALEDLRAYIQNLIAAQPGAAVEKKTAPARVDFAQYGPVLKKPLSSLRKTIAKRMSESWSAVPRVTQFDEADITGLNDLRKKYAPAYEKQGAKLTLTVFAIKAVVAALKKHPIFNSSLDEVAEEIVLKEYFHIGIAVDTEHGLMVPVIRDADKKSLLQIAKELEDLAGKTRDRKLTGDQMKGGSFTISNQGGIGSGAFTPIVNVPEVAILGLGRGAVKPAVVAGKIEARLLMPVAISYDHRVIDGGSAARFTVDLVAAFQNFDEKDVKI